MKLIQIFVLATFTAAGATAQNTAAGASGQPGGATKQNQKPAPAAASQPKPGSQKAQSGNQGAGVKLIVPKNSAAGTSASAKGAHAATKTPGTSSAQASGKPPAKSKPTAAQKGPVLMVPPKPAVKGKQPVVAAGSNKAPGKDKNQIKIVPHKGGNDTKSAEALPPAATANGRRDPFVSVIRNMPSTPSGPGCSVGKRCLFIPELQLKGIAKDTEGQMMAVVVSNTHRAYFLRENDQVFNGSVQKITSDSIIFREFATDHLGRETAHEVVKRIPRS